MLSVFYVRLATEYLMAHGARFGLRSEEVKRSKNLSPLTSGVHLVLI